MVRTLAKGVGKARGSAVGRGKPGRRVRGRRTKGAARGPDAESLPEGVTPEEMVPVAAATASTEDAEDREEIRQEGDEWPG